MNGQALGEMSLDARIRKMRSYLLYGGAAFIILGLWDGIKTGLYMYFHPAEALEEFNSGDQLQNYDESMYYTIMVVIILAFFLIFFTLRVYIGLKAVSVARGRNTKARVYVVLTGLYTIGTVYTGIDEILHPVVREAHEAHLINFIIEASSLLVMIIIIVSSVSLWKLDKQKAATQAQGG